MNERIKELIGQAQKEVWGNSRYNGSPEFEGYELDAEKFAELIVRECAKIIEAQDCDPSFKNRLSWAMKDKFGVDIK